METIKNDQLSVIISPHGAELQSIKNNRGHEFLWQGDPKYWGRRSPILFPIVGSLWNGTAHFGGKDCQMGRHGFARDMDFKLVAKGDAQAVFALHDNDETLKKYPYHFNLAVSYKLKGNTIAVTWHVENTDDKPISFQIGGHPAFNIPDLKAGEPIHCMDSIFLVFSPVPACQSVTRFHPRCLIQFPSAHSRPRSQLLYRCHLRG